MTAQDLLQGALYAAGAFAVYRAALTVDGWLAQRSRQVMDHLTTATVAVSKMSIRVLPDPQFREARDTVEPIARRYDLVSKLDGTQMTYTAEGAAAMARLLRSLALATDQGAEYHRKMHPEHYEGQP